MLYKDTVARCLGITCKAPFSVVQAIISKEPKEPNDTDERKDELTEIRKNWKEQQCYLASKMNLSLCRDIVGNTICADFLDYLHRDWHHLGKPLYEDTRIYQYMEARKYQPEKHTPPEPRNKPRPTDLQFVINIGSGEKIRHDALTSILQLLEARYELAETVLFHRSKLSITALLDRCLLEIGYLYEVAGVPRHILRNDLEESLLKGSDDALPDVLVALMEESSNKDGAKLVGRAIARAESSAASAVKDSSSTGNLFTAAFKSDIRALRDSILGLIERLPHRSMYRMLYKLKFSELQGSPHGGESIARRIVDLYADVQNRHDFLRGLEACCQLPQYSLVMYCPPIKMNAKVADVKLLMENEVRTFAEYDKEEKQYSLTRGALSSRTRRFSELWSTQIFLHRDVWPMLDKSVRGMPETGLKHLKEVVGTFLFQSDPHNRGNIARTIIQTSINALVDMRILEAARQGTTDYELDRLGNFTFPSGLPFKCPMNNDARSGSR